MKGILYENEVFGRGGCYRGNLCLAYDCFGSDKLRRCASKNIGSAYRASFFYACGCARTVCRLYSSEYYESVRADLIFGSAASLIGAIGSYLLRKKPLLVPLAPVISNGIIVGAMLYYVYEVPLPLIVQMLYVALGEVVACYAIGYPLMKYLNKYKRIF